VATGSCHALALTERGELYGWGGGLLVPQRVVELVGEHVKLVAAKHDSSIAMTESGELFAWGTCHLFNIVHVVDIFDPIVYKPQVTLKRVEGLGGVKVAAVAIGADHTLLADEDGVVWEIGRRCTLGLDDEPVATNVVVEHPMPIPALRVRARKSPRAQWCGCESEMAGQPEVGNCDDTAWEGGGGAGGERDAKVRAAWAARRSRSQSYPFSLHGGSSSGWGFSFSGVGVILERLPRKHILPNTVRKVSASYIKDSNNISKDS